jgi:endonuclease G
MYKKIVLLFAILYCSISIGQIPQIEKIPNLELPLINNKDEIVHHTAYTLSYNEKHEQANWVAYELTEEETLNGNERTNKFLEDPLVYTGSATNEDYSKSGYDRGHLAPAADMGWSYTTMAESFYFSNMSPQVPGFNRGIWKKLEELVRDWANEYHSIYVVTGPILTSELPTIGANKVSVPNYYYKAILEYNSTGKKAIGFILPNQSSSEPLEHFAVSIDSIESLTGFDLFYQLPDDQEKKLEKRMDINSWNWTHSTSQHISTRAHQNNESTNNQQHSSQNVRCSGTTKSGSQCKRMTKNPNGRCFSHQ